MDPKLFASSAAGRVVRRAEGFSAFVPAPLPPALEYDRATVLLLSQADAALSELSGLGRHLPNPHLLITPYVRREAVLSSKIEGTKTNLAELLLDEVDPRAVEQDPDDVREVRNYVRALEHGLRQLKELPLSLRLVREIHRELMRGVRGEQAGLSLIYAVTVDVAKRWRGIRISPADLEKLNGLRGEVAPLRATA